MTTVPYCAEHDAAIIAEGTSAGMRPDRGDAIAGFPDPHGIRWLWFRAACARAEMNVPGACVDYLRARASQADNEAAAREFASVRLARERARAGCGAGARAAGGAAE